MAVELHDGGSAARRAETAPIEDVVMLLRAILGPQLVASIAGRRTQSCVAGWTQGRGRLSALGQVRLRIALELVLVIVEADGIEAARNWLARRDPALEGRSPLAVLAQEPPRQARRTLLRNARTSLRRGDVSARIVPGGRPGPSA